MKTFSRADILSVHKKSIHSEIRPFECEICRKVCPKSPQNLYILSLLRKFILQAYVTIKQLISH